MSCRFLSTGDTWSVTSEGADVPSQTPREVMCRSWCYLPGREGGYLTLGELETPSSVQAMNDEGKKE